MQAQDLVDYPDLRSAQAATTSRIREELHLGESSFETDEYREETWQRITWWLERHARNSFRPVQLAMLFEPQISVPLPYGRGAEERLTKGTHGTEVVMLYATDVLYRTAYSFMVQSRGRQPA